MYAAQINQLLIQGPQAPLLASISVSKPNAEEREAKGELVIMLELPGNNARLQVTVAEFIKEIESAYYSSPETDTELSLEHALRIVNAQLPSLATRLDKRWPEKTTVVLLVYKNDNLFFATAGQAWGLFMTPNKSFVITETNKEKKIINALKPFSSISSGQLPQDSAICFASQTLLDYISSEKLRKLCLQNTPLRVVQDLESLLEQASPQLNIMAVFIRRITLHESNEVNAKPTAWRSDKNDNSENRTVISQANTLPTSEQSIKNLASRRSDTAKLLSVPSLRQTFGLRVKAGMDQLSASAKKVTDPELWRNVATAAKRQKLVMATATRNYRQKIKASSAYWWPPKRWLTGIALWVSTVIRRVRGLNRAGQFILGIICLALIVFSQAILSQQSALQRNQSLLPTNFINSVQSSLDSASNALIYGDQQRSISLIDEINVKISALDTKQKNDPSLQPLIGRLNDLQNKLGKTIKLADLPVITHYDSQPQDLIFNSNALWLATPLNIESYNLKTSAKTTPSPLSANNRHLITNDGKIIYALSGEDMTTIANNQSLALEFKHATGTTGEISLKAYSARLYALDKTGSQIYRYQRVGNMIDNGTSWLQKSLSPGSLIDIGLDGSLYALTSNSILKFSRGVPATFALHGVWPTLQQPTKLFVGNKFLYVLEPSNQRLVIINKLNGQLDRQYKNSILGTASSFTVDDVEKTAYVVSGQDVRKLDLTAR